MSVNCLVDSSSSPQPSITGLNEQKRYGRTPVVANNPCINAHIAQHEAQARQCSASGGMLEIKGHQHRRHGHEGQDQTRDRVLPSDRHFAPHIAAHDQAVQMLFVGLARVGFFQASAVDAEQDLHHRVDANEQGGKGRHLGVALHHQHGHPGQSEAAEIRAPIAQENFAHRPVDDKKAQHGRSDGHAGIGQVDVAHIHGDPSHAGKAQQNHATGQAMETINHVDGVGHAADGKRREQHGYEQVGQEQIDQVDVHMGDGHMGDPPTQSAGQHGGQQTRQHRNLLGDIFGQAKHKGWDTRQQQRTQESLSFRA